MTDQPDTIPCDPPVCELCGYGDECSCADCAVGENVVLLAEYDEGELGTC